MPATHIITILGPKQSGTTQLYHRIGEKKPFEKNYKPVTSIRFYSKEYTYTNQKLNVQYCDVGPNSTIEKINAQLLKTHLICLVFDTMDVNWETSLDEYLLSISLPPSVPIVLVGTKFDLWEPSQAFKLEERAKAYAQNKFQQVACVIVSSKNGYNLDRLAQTFLDNLPDLSAKAAVQTHIGEAADKSSDAAITVLEELLAELVKRPDCDDEVVQIVVQRLLAHAPENPRVQQMVASATPKKNVSTSSPSKKQLNDFPPVPTSIPPIKGTHPTPLADTYLSFALRMAGMAIMLAALTSLIYLAAVAASLVSAVALTAAVDQIVLAVGGLFSMAAPAAVFGSACAALGISTSAGSGILAASASLLTMGLGYGLMRLGKKLTAEEGTAVTAVPTSYFALTLRIMGLTLLATALANLVYLALLATQVLSAVTFTSAMNHMIVTIGTILGMTEPLLAFSNAAAAIGLSTAAASQIISATGSVVTMGLGFCLFRAGKLASATDNQGASPGARHR